MPRLVRSLPLSLLLAAPVAAAADFDHALVILVDDLGVDKVGAYAADVDNPGEQRPATPTMDLLAAAGTRFSDAWATPVCSPTRATVYAGAYPYRTGIGTVIAEQSTKKLPTSPSTLPKVAVDAGLQAGLFGKWHVGETTRTLDAPGTVENYKEYPVTAGFTWYAGNMDGELQGYTDWLYTVSSPTGTRGRYRTTAVQSTAFAPGQTTADAVAWMQSQSAAGKRRLTVVAYNLVHATRSSSMSPSWTDAAAACGAVAGTSEVANHRVAVECLDAEVRELLLGTPDLDHTLVMLMGDNGTPAQVGEGLFADGRGKATAYESGIRVPFLVADGRAVGAVLGGAAPGSDAKVLAGAVSADPASVVDVYATVADYLGLGSTSCAPGVTCGLDSMSLRAVLAGGAPLRTDVWSEMYSGSRASTSGVAAVREGDVKLIVTVARGCRSYKMYDLATDRWEHKDLFADAARSDERTALLDLLAAHEAEMPTPWIPAAVCSTGVSMGPVADPSTPG